jgi:hypothetical protein
MDEQTGRSLKPYQGQAFIEDYPEGARRPVKDVTVGAGSRFALSDRGESKFFD